MSPRYLADQIGRSRTNLGLETLDLLYLHNPAEAQLSEVGPEEFQRRLADAFRELEKQRRNGALRAYGLATWDTFRVRRIIRRYLSLESVVATARDVGGDHHGFRFVQFPFNLAMPEAASLRLQPVGGERRSLFEAARTLGIDCFTSVPLMQGRLARAASGSRPGFRARSRALQFARSAPGTLAPLVGQKTAVHLSENLALAGREPWDSGDVRRRAPLGRTGRRIEAGAPRPSARGEGGRGHHRGRALRGIAGDEPGPAAVLLDADHAVRDRGELRLVADEKDLRESEPFQQLAHPDHLLRGEPVGRLIEDQRLEAEASGRPDDLAEREPERKRQGRPLARRSGPRPASTRRRSRRRARTPRRIAR